MRLFFSYGLIVTGYQLLVAGFMEDDITEDGQNTDFQDFQDKQDFDFCENPFNPGYLCFIPSLK